MAGQEQVQVQGGIGFQPGVGPDGTAIVQIDFVQGTFRFTLVIPADQAHAMADGFSQNLKEAGREARRKASGLVVASEVPKLNGRQ